MNTSPRITSILQTPCLDTSITGLPTFDLAVLEVDNDVNFLLPTNLRLGHVAEKVVLHAIEASTNYDTVLHNIQVLDNKQTIGELDFILEEVATQKLIHVELAYKFYLYDPSISHEPIHNWIGPNRNDSLDQKLTKLKDKQFPLLHHPCTASALGHLDTHHVSQALCLLVSLFVPFAYTGSFSPAYQKAIQGYYLDIDTFHRLDNENKTYYLPSNKEWGIDPTENKTWTEYASIKGRITAAIEKNQAPLCWQKSGDSYTAFFIIWW